MSSEDYREFRLKEGSKVVDSVRIKKGGPKKLAQRGGGGAAVEGKMRRSASKFQHTAQNHKSQIRDVIQGK